METFLESAGKFLRCSKLIRNMQDQEVHKTLKIYQAVDAVKKFQLRGDSYGTAYSYTEDSGEVNSNSHHHTNGLANMYLAFEPSVSKERMQTHRIISWVWEEVFL